MESAALPKPEAFEIPLDELRAGAPGKKLATRPKLGSTATIQVKSSEKWGKRSRKDTFRREESN